MKSSIRVYLIPSSVVLFVIGLLIGKALIFGIIAVAIIVFSVLFYSHRKQRVRYWIQGYQIYLEKNNGNEVSSPRALKEEFCTSKYAEEKICDNEYSSLDVLVEDIIKREFKFDILLQSRSLDPKDVEKNLAAYMKAKVALRSEIADVKKEVLQSI